MENFGNLLEYLKKCLFYLFYADDVFLFGAATITNMEIMLETLEEFGRILGLQVNFAKSSLIFQGKWITMLGILLKMFVFSKTLLRL